MILRTGPNAMYDIDKISGIRTVEDEMLTKTWNYQIILDGEKIWVTKHDFDQIKKTFERKNAHLIYTADYKKVNYNWDKGEIEDE